MPIQPVSNLNNNSKRKFNVNPVTYTGYGALALGTASVIAAANKKIKWHKYFAYAAGALAFIHTGIIEGLRFSRNKGEK